MHNVEIYTDGSCRGNGTKDAPGGWGYVALFDGVKIKEDLGGEKNTTNNRMEMMAVLNACRYYDDKLNVEPANCTIYTDSAYIHNCITQNWWKNWVKNGWINSKKEPVKNKDLWLKIIPFFQRADIQFKKVKGHSGIEWNEKADNLARQMPTAYKVWGENNENNSN